MFQLCDSGLFNGLAHPDSIKCFGYKPDIDLTEYYNKLAVLLNKNGMYAENSGGLQLKMCIRDSHRKAGGGAWEKSTLFRGR